MKSPNNIPDREHYATPEQINGLVYRYAPLIQFSQKPPVGVETNDQANPVKSYFLGCENKQLRSLREFKDFESCQLILDIYAEGTSMFFTFVAHPLADNRRHLIRREITLLSDGSASDFTSYTDTVDLDRTIEQQALLTVKERRATLDQELAEENLEALIDDLEGMPKAPTGLTANSLGQLEVLLLKIIPTLPD